MSVNEINEWAEYLSKEPSNSTEIQLALLSHIVASFAGNKKSSLENMLITNYKIEVEKPLFTPEKEVIGIFSMISK